MSYIRNIPTMSNVPVEKNQVKKIKQINQINQINNKRIYCDKKEEKVIKYTKKDHKFNYEYFYE
jgi:hypothetical protein